MILKISKFIRLMGYSFMSIAFCLTAIILIWTTIMYSVNGSTADVLFESNIIYHFIFVFAGICAYIASSTIVFLFIKD